MSGKTKAQLEDDVRGLKGQLGAAASRGTRIAEGCERLRGICNVQGARIAELGAENARLAESRAKLGSDWEHLRREDHEHRERIDDLTVANTVLRGQLKAIRAIAKNAEKGL